MIKMIGLLKRRPGMSSGEFRAYYESTHRRIGEKYLRKYACNYMRRYLTPFPNPLTGETRLDLFRYRRKGNAWRHVRNSWLAAEKQNTDPMQTILFAPGFPDLMIQLRERMK